MCYAATFFADKGCNQVVGIIHRQTLNLHASDDVHGEFIVTWIHAPVRHLTCNIDVDSQRSLDVIVTTQVNSLLVFADRRGGTDGEGHCGLAQRVRGAVFLADFEP